MRLINRPRHHHTYLPQGNSTASPSCRGGPQRGRPSEEEEEEEGLPPPSYEDIVLKPTAAAAAADTDGVVVQVNSEYENRGGRRCVLPAATPRGSMDHTIIYSSFS